MRYEKRLQALEARRPPRDYALIDTMSRAFAAAVRDKIRRRLDGEADTPEQASEYATLLDRWRAVHGVGAAEGAQDRMAARLDRMAARYAQVVPPWEPHKSPCAPIAPGGSHDTV
jgi:hypothetical protein